MDDELIAEQMAEAKFVVVTAYLVNDQLRVLERFEVRLIFFWQGNPLSRFRFFIFAACRTDVAVRTRGRLAENLQQFVRGKVGFLDVEVDVAARARRQIGWDFRDGESLGRRRKAERETMEVSRDARCWLIKELRFEHYLTRAAAWRAA